MAQENTNLSKNYYSVIPIQELEQISAEDINLFEDTDLIPIGLQKKGLTSNAISLQTLQELIDTKGVTYDVVTSNHEGLMSAEDKQHLDDLYNNSIKHLIDGQTNGSLRTTTSTEENENYSLGEGAISFGTGTKANGNYSYAEGYNTVASGEASHAQGSNTIASGDYSHTEGLNTIASRKSQTVIGQYNIEDTQQSSPTVQGQYAFIIGNGNENNRSNAFTVDWNGNTRITGILSATNVSISGTPSENKHLVTKEYTDNAISNYFSENGLHNLEDGNATGSVQSIASQATGNYSYAEGRRTIASGDYSHAEGYTTNATLEGAHSEGSYTIASEQSSHAQGSFTQASGKCSHAQGFYTQAKGDYSHTSGNHTIANGENEFVIGRYNKFQNIIKETENIQTILIDIDNMSQSYTLLHTQQKLL